MSVRAGADAATSERAGAAARIRPQLETNKHGILNFTWDTVNSCTGIAIQNHSYYEPLK